MKFSVRVPATTANLGPGFDCLGLALDLWNEVIVSTTGTTLGLSIEGEGILTLPKNTHNAIYQAMQIYAARHSKTLPSGLEIHCLNRIPLGSGLGSSAAAAVAGILAAAQILEIEEDQNDQLACAAQMEGHPDNVAPCLLGGLVASAIENGQIIFRNLPIQLLTLVIVTPDFSFPTRTARAALPVNVPMKDAVFNVSRSILLVEALRSGDFGLLRTMMQDQLHQPYRLPLIPGAAAAINSGMDAGAAAVVISGAGPSLLAVLPDPADAQGVAGAMTAAFQQAGLAVRTFTPAISYAGAVIKKP